MSVRVTLPDGAQIREVFTFEDPEFGAFTDAIYWTPTEYLASTLTQRDAQKQARYDDWLATARASQEQAASE